MAVRSIIDIEVNDQAFQKFKAAYADYEKLLDKTPEAWEKVTKQAGLTTDEFNLLVENANRGVEAARGRAEAEKTNANALDTQSKSVTRQANSWHAISRDTKAFAANVKDATISLVKWAGITGLLSGIIGGGGLLGIDSLARSVSGQRKSAGGLGVTIGEKSAFETNYGRLLDSPSGFLETIADAKSDVTKASPFRALGLDYNTEQSKDSAQVGIDVIRGVKSLTDQWRAENLASGHAADYNLGNQVNARQLGMVGLSVENVRRIMNRPPAELGEYEKNYSRDQNSLNITDPTAKAWEDFKVQLGRASGTIEKVFVEGLEKLTPELTSLSADITGLLKDFLEGGEAKMAVDGLKSGLHWLDDTLKDPSFKHSIQGFVTDVEKLALAIGGALHSLAGWVTGTPKTPAEQSEWDKEEARRKASQDEWDKAHGLTPSASGTAHSGIDLYKPWGGAPPAGADLNRPLPWGGRPNGGALFSPAAFHPGDPSLPRGIRNNNPLNLSYVPGQDGVLGSDGRFGVYGSPEEGISAETRQLLLYQDRDHLNTLRGIIGKWAPGSENDTGAYLRSVQRSTGFGADQPLDLHDAATTRELIAAMGRVENGRDVDPDAIRRGVDRGLGIPSAAKQPYAQQFKDRSVQVHVYDRTGGNVNVSAQTLTT